MDMHREAFNLFLPLIASVVTTAAVGLASSWLARRTQSGPRWRTLTAMTQAAILYLGLVSLVRPALDQAIELGLLFVGLVGFWHTVMLHLYRR
jgi:hypothetical protein